MFVNLLLLLLSFLKQDKNINIMLLLIGSFYMSLFPFLLKTLKKLKNVLVNIVEEKNLGYVCRIIPANDDYDECVHSSCKFFLIMECLHKFESLSMKSTICAMNAWSLRFGNPGTHVNRWKFDFLTSIPRWKICRFLLWFEPILKWEITTQHYTDFFLLFAIFFFKRESYSVSFGMYR